MVIITITLLHCVCWASKMVILLILTSLTDHKSSNKLRIKNKKFQDVHVFSARRAKSKQFLPGNSVFSMLVWFVLGDKKLNLKHLDEFGRKG